MYNTNGTVVVVEDEDNDDKEVRPSRDVIQLQGDQRDNINKFLTEFNICKKSEITIHGF